MVVYMILVSLLIKCHDTILHLSAKTMKTPISLIQNALLDKLYKHSDGLPS